MTNENLQVTARSHQSALASHYDDSAERYDAFNEEESRTINSVIENIFKQHDIKSVHDISCGTGSQVFWLTRAGFDVSGSDINEKMLEVARSRMEKDKLSEVRFLNADMRNVELGCSCDSIISIFNAVGHLTKSDFEKAIKNVVKQLRQGGLFVFDIFNLNYLLHEDQITKFTIDWLKEEDGVQARKIQYSTIDQEGIMASCTTLIRQVVSKCPVSETSWQTLQVYSSRQLRDILEDLGLEVLQQTDVDGSALSELHSERILTISRKI